MFCIPDTMLACQIVEFKKPYEVRQVPVAKHLKPHEILIKVAVASFCHTDFMVLEGLTRAPLPLIPSHEGAGTVALVGSSVERFQPGMRVLGHLVSDLCGKCPECRGPEGCRQYCDNIGAAPGLSRDGAFAEYMIVDSRTAALLPDSLPFKTAAPLACGGCTIWRGVMESGVKGGGWLALVGSGGGLGHIGIQLAKTLGMYVIGIDARDEGLALSAKVGADIVLDARKGKTAVLDEVLRATGGRGVDATLNVSDHPEAAETAATITKKHGTMIQIAQPANVSISFQHLVFRDVRVQGSLMCSPQEFTKMIDFVANNQIFVEIGVYRGLYEVPRLAEDAKSGRLVGKGVVIIDENQT
ncbi:alcohol dehydrogenase [Dactylonectria macrodidyma]|uniref:Alcohol dehydrogenase n=1 Tax=Dactylonectria macrodidyma TaxID=307937 RepID=A0A9P9ESA3_9HYPO|nr:alcohol dehydrogenase [Dactylonectria macrodidyma]